MAETYKGLTIRIGGDTTKLQQSLRAADSAITNTQSQLRKMTQALKFDPSSTKAAVTSLELMADKAVEVNRRLSELRDAQRKIANQKVDFGNNMQSLKTLQQLADETDDISQRAADAKNQYNNLNAELEKLYRETNNVARASERFGKSFDIRDESDLESIRADLVSVGAATDETVDRMQQLRSMWQTAFNENEIGKALLQFRDLQSEITKTSAEAKSTSNTFLQMSRSISKLKMESSIDDELRKVSAAADSTDEHIQRMLSTLKQNPTSVESIREAMVSLDDAARLTQQRISLLGDKIGELQRKGAKDLPSDMADVAMNAQRAADNLQEASDNVSRLKGEIQTMQATWTRMTESGDTGSDEYQKLEERIRGARIELEKLETAQREAQNAFDQSVANEQLRETKVLYAEATAQAERYAQAQKEITSSGGVRSNTLMELGMTLSTSVTPAMTAMGYAAIQSARDIDSAYRDMRKTVNGTEEDFERLRQAAIDFSTTHVTSADQILSIQAIGGELGVAVEDLETFAETVSNLEVATDLGADEAATALGQLDNIMDDLSGATMPAFSDALVRLGNNGASTESQIVDIAARIGSMSSIIGMSTPEVLAWASTIASTGQNAEAAGTAIANTMSDIEQAVARGGESLDAFASVAQMSAEDFANAWNTDPSSALEAFIKGLVAVEEQGGSATATLDDLEIRAARQVQAIEGLMQTVGMLDDNLQMSNNAWNGVSDQWGEAGDAANEASKKADGFSGSIQRLLNMAQVLGAELGESIGPWVDALADGLGDLTNLISGLPDEGKQLIVALGGIAAAAGPVLLFARAISSTIQDISKGMKLASATTEALGGAATGASQTLLGLKGGLIGLGVAIAGVGITALVSHFAELEEQERLAERASSGLAEACGAVTEAMSGTSDESEEFSESVKQVSDAADDSTKKLAELADEFDDLNRQTATTLGGLNSAQDSVRNLANRSDLTAGQVGELKHAIDYLNDSCGTNYEVVRNDAGVYQILADGARVAKDEIYKLIEAQKQQVIADAQNEKLKGLYENKIQFNTDYQEALNNQAEALERYNAAVREYDKAAESGASDSRLAELNEIKSSALADLQSANDSVSEIGRNIENLNSDIEIANSTLGNMTEATSGAIQGFEQFAKGSSAVNAALKGDSDVIKDFSDALEDSGYSIEFFADLGDTKMQQLATSWANGGGTISEILAQIGADAVTASQDVIDALMGMNNGQVANAITMAGINLDEFATAMTMAGIKAQDLNAIGSENFTAMAANCGGSIQQLLFMIQNYNGTPIYNKDGTITVETTQLMDAEGQIYTWNGSDLIDKTGNVVVDQMQLVDCMGNVVQYNGPDYKLQPKEGQVFCTYDELLQGMDAITAFKNLDGTTVTTYVDTVYRTFYNNSSGGAKGGTLSGALGGGTRRSAAVPQSVEPVSTRISALSAMDPLASAVQEQAAAIKTSAVRLQSVPDIASRAATLSYENSLIGVRTVSRGLDSEHGVGGLTRISNLRAQREQAQTNVNVTIDGTGTTGRIEAKVLDLLDELERLGAI